MSHIESYIHLTSHVYRVLHPSHPQCVSCIIHIQYCLTASLPCIILSCSTIGQYIRSDILTTWHTVACYTVVSSTSLWRTVLNRSIHHTVWCMTRSGELFNSPKLEVMRDKTQFSPHLQRNERLEGWKARVIVVLSFTYHLDSLQRHWDNQMSTLLCCQIGLLPY
jgi:hypothetical protein